MRDRAKTALFVTHSIDEALEVGDRIMVLRRPAQIAFEAKVGGLIAPDHKTGLRAEILRVLAGNDQPEAAVD